MTWHLTGRRPIHMGSEMSFCTCSLIKSTSCETNREKKNNCFQNMAPCDNIFIRCQLLLDVCKLKDLEAFKGHTHSPVNRRSRILKCNSCTESLWLNAAENDADCWPEIKRQVYYWHPVEIRRNCTFAFISSTVDDLLSLFLCTTKSINNFISLPSSLNFIFQLIHACRQWFFLYIF